MGGQLLCIGDGDVHTCWSGRVLAGPEQRRDARESDLVCCFSQQWWFLNIGVLELKATSGANKVVGYVVSCCRRVKGAACGVSSSLGCRCEGDKNHS